MMLHTLLSCAAENAGLENARKCQIAGLEKQQDMVEQKAILRVQPKWQKPKC